MFVIPAVLSLTIDITIAVLYFEDPPALTKKASSYLHLLDISQCNFLMVRRATAI